MNMERIESHEIDYEIFGSDIQYVEIELDPGETVIANPGAMIFMEEDITFEAKMGDGNDANWRVLRKLKSAALRSAVGGSVFLAHFTNSSSARKRRVGFGTASAGEIVPIDLSGFSNGLLVQRGSFLCAAKGTKLAVDLNRGVMAGKLGGEGFAMVNMSGDGMSFIHASGKITELSVDDSTLRIATGAVMAFESHLDYSVSLAGGLKSMAFGGEGMWVTTLTGTGTVWIQSLAVDRYNEQIVDYVLEKLNKK